MSVKQAMIWTVCPVGQTKVTTGPKPGIYLDFSVIISPRLESSSSTELVLSDFPDWSPVVSSAVGHGRTWPETIALLEPSFELHLPQLPGAPTYHAELVHTTTGALFGSQSPDAIRWSAMFPPDTPVTPYVFQGMGTRQIRSAPVGQLNDTIISLYGRFGMTSPTLFPLYEHLAPADAFGPIGFQQFYELDRQESDKHPDPGIHGIGVDRKAQLVKLLDDSIKQSRAIPYDLGPLAKTLGSKEPPGAVTSLAFLQQQQFLQRGLKPHLSGPESPVTPPVWDFHQIVAGVGSLPSLLRILGLVLDLRAGPVGPKVLDAWKAAAADKHFVDTEAIFVFNAHQLLMPPGKSANHTHNVRPPTASETDRGVFRAKPLDPSNTDLDGTMLKLGDRSLYRIIRVDHDNAVMKAMQFADNLTRSRQQGQKLTLTTPDRFAMPALRTGGFAIARSGRAVQMAATLQRQTEDLQEGYFGSKPTSPLYAEDITRGYRFDVFSKPDPVWRSLMWREGTITVAGTDPVTVLEEDAVVPAPTTATKSGKGDLYLQETLTRWDGWSLGVPRIGTAFYDPSTDSPPSSNQGSTGFNVTTNWQVPGSNSNPAVAETNTDNSFRLPRLRFGWPYRLRGRAVDLAGNSVEPARAPKSGQPISAYETHLRMEPVAAPRMLLLDVPGPGESEEVLVIRSENALDDGGLPIDTGVSTRIILPAPTSVFMAEQHGAWDLPATGTPMDDTATRYNDIAVRDATTIESLGELVDLTLPHSQTNPYLFPAYLPISYLPEFIGRVALVRGLPINSSKQRVAKLPFDTSGAGWPSLQADRIVLTRGVPDWTTRTVTDPDAPSNVTTELDLTLDKGDMITCLLNCEIGASALAVMGIWEWIQAEAAAAKLSTKKLKEIEASILAGEHWMITPWREVRFVHAVRTPLLAPRLFLSPSKSSIGQTYAAFEGLKNAAWGTVLMSRKSTARIDVDATWAMPVDTGSNTDPVTPVQFAGHAFSLELARIGAGKRPDIAHPPDDPATDFENFDESHQFNDTKFRAVNYQATATSYYIEYFRQELTLASGGDPIELLRTEGAVKPGVAFEGTTVKLFLVGTDSSDPDNPKIQTRPLVEAPIGTDPDISAPTPGDFVVVQDPTLASDPSSALNGTIQILTGSTIASTDVKGTPSVVFSYVGPTIHTYSDPSTDHTTSASMHIPNSARPAAPDVLYVIPVYQRTSTTTSITRTGGALRVYMNRPWWTSGDEERLGVVCWHQGSKNKNVTPPSSLLPYVTLWGFDPIHQSRETLTSKTKQPTPACFPLATASSSNGSLTLDEVSSTVDVAGHDVGFDSGRGLWYCDIKVTSPDGKELESYTPFIRFAFARYQPTSIPNTHLSKVVTADYAQLAPNRHVTVVGQSNGNNGGQFAVTVAGFAPITPGHSGKPSSGASRMRLTVEAQDVRILDDNLAWKPLTANGKPLSQRLVSSVTDTDVVTFTGSVVVPNGGSPTRLTIEEFELIDGSERLAFSDSIPLTPLID